MTFRRGLSKQNKDKNKKINTKIGNINISMFFKAKSLRAKRSGKKSRF